MSIEGSDNWRRHSGERKRQMMRSSDLPQGGGDGINEKEISQSEKNRINDLAAKIRFTNDGCRVIGKIASTAESLSETSRVDALLSVIKLQSKIGISSSSELHTQVRELIDTIDSPRQKALALLDFGEILSEKDPESGKALSEEVLAMTTTQLFSEIPEDDTEAIITLSKKAARLFAKSGDISRACTVATELNRFSPYDTFDALIDVAAVEVQQIREGTEDTDLHSLFFDEQEDTSREALTLAYNRILEEEAAYEDRSDSVSIDEFIGVNFERTRSGQDDCLHRIAELFIKASDYQGAKVLIGKIADNELKVRALQSLAHEYVRIGWVDQAFALPNELSDTFPDPEVREQRTRFGKDKITKSIAEGLSENGELQLAVDLVMNVREQVQVNVLRQVVEAFSLEGVEDTDPQSIRRFFDQSLIALENIDAPGDKVTVMAKLAAALKKNEEEIESEFAQQFRESLAGEIESVRQEGSSVLSVTEQVAVLSRLAQVEADLDLSPQSLPKVEILLQEVPDFAVEWLQVAKAYAKAGKTPEALVAFHQIEEFRRAEEVKHLLPDLSLSDEFVSEMSDSLLEDSSSFAHRSVLRTIAKEQYAQGKDPSITLAKMANSVEGFEENALLESVSYTDVAETYLACGLSLDAIADLTERDLALLRALNNPQLYEAMQRFYPLADES